MVCVKAIVRDCDFITHGSLQKVEARGWAGNVAKLRPLFRLAANSPDRFSALSYMCHTPRDFRSKGGLSSLIYLSLPTTFDFEANFRGTWHIYAWRRGGFLVPGLVPIKGNKGRPSQIVALVARSYDAVVCGKADEPVASVSAATHAKDAKVTRRHDSLRGLSHHPTPFPLLSPHHTLFQRQPRTRPPSLQPPPTPPPLSPPPHPCTHQRLRRLGRRVELSHTRPRRFVRHVGFVWPTELGRGSSGLSQPRRAS